MQFLVLTCCKKASLTGFPTVIWLLIVVFIWFNRITTNVIVTAFQNWIASSHAFLSHRSNVVQLKKKNIISVSRISNIEYFYWHDSLVLNIVTFKDWKRWQQSLQLKFISFSSLWVINEIKRSISREFRLWKMCRFLVTRSLNTDSELHRNMRFNDINQQSIMFSANKW